MTKGIPSAGIITLDVHGKTRAQAAVAIRAAIRRCDGSVYRIRVIHGYNRGALIRDQVRAEDWGDRVKRVVPGQNDGISELILREY